MEQALEVVWGIRNSQTATGSSVKLADRGVQHMMVGYAENHDGDVYWMWNPLTEHVPVTWDIIWLKQMMFQK